MIIYQNLNILKTIEVHYVDLYYYHKDIVLTYKSFEIDVTNYVAKLSYEHIM